jgi:gliding motility-associated lipoprotein GldH
MNSIGAALFILGGLSACHRPFASAEQSFEGECWPMGDTLDLSFNNEDTSQVLQLWFPLTLTEAYSYNNIYLQAELTPPSGETSVLPARFPLAEADGTWLSDGKGAELKFDLLMSGGLRFNQKGNYRIRCYQYMRDSLLCGVKSAGITLDIAAADSASGQ